MPTAVFGANPRAVCRRPTTARIGRHGVMVSAMAKHKENGAAPAVRSRPEYIPNRIDDPKYAPGVTATGC